MKGYDYYRDAWPLIVEHAFSCGAAIYESVLVRDESGKPIRYEKGRRLDRDAALEFRGETWTVYEPAAQAELSL